MRSILVIIAIVAFFIAAFLFWDDRPKEASTVMAVGLAIWAMASVVLSDIRGR